MSTKTTFALALAAGFLGGIVSQHIAPALVYAQSPSPILKEIRAESFVIVDSTGKPRGAFAVDPKNGWPMVEITDPKGHAWRPRFEGVGWGNRKPTLVPPQ